MWYLAVIIVMATRSVFVLATVVSIRDKFCYPCCTQCHKKVHTREDETTFWCEGCREEYSTESVQYRYRISVTASDRTQMAQITVFGSCLDSFFGTSATSFMRFVNSIKSDSFSVIPCSHVVHQAMEQCFVGALLQFGFRIYSPCRTASQNSRHSPFHLKNIVNKQRKSENTRCQPEQFPSLLACQIFPCSSTDQSPTVIQILNEYLQELHRRTPESFNLRSSQCSPFQDGSQSQASYEAFLVTRRPSLQGKRASSIYCTPQEFGSMNTPLVLTGTSQPSSGAVLTQETVLGSDSKDRRKSAHLYIQSNASSLPNEGINSSNSHSPSVIQPMTPAKFKSGKLNTNLTDDCTEQNLSHVWTEYDDFPSSENLSAFLADLERDATRRDESRATLPSVQSEKCNDPLQSVTSDAMTTEITTLKDVCEISRTSKAEDFTEFTDFPSSEDLDAFLADMELDCENIPVTKSLTPKTTVVSTVLNSKPHCKMEVSRSFVGKEHVLEGVVDAGSSDPSSESHEDNIETEEAFCDLELTADSCCAQEDAKPPCSVNYSSYSDKMVYDSDCSDAQFLRDCESAFSELTENICNEDRTERKPNCNLLKSVLLKSFEGKAHVLEGIVDAGSSDPSSESHEDNIETEEVFCDMELGRDSAQEEARTPCSVNCFSYSDKMVNDSDCSDSQFLRDCESVFSELTENICNEDRAGRKANCNLLKSVLLSNQRRYISRNCREDVNDISTKRSKLFCRSGPADELLETDFVCNTPLRDNQTCFIRSRVRNANETDEDQQRNQRSIDHYDNNEVSMLNDSCDMMAGTPFSPDLFSQSLSVMEECYSKTPDLFFSPRLVNAESRSRCTEHSATPDLFSSPGLPGVHTRSCTKEELNSVSLFSSSECSHLSSASSLSTERRASFPSPAHLAACGNEAASLPNEGHCDIENKLNRNSLPLSFHSTPYFVPITSLSRAWTPLQVSPLLASAGSNRCSDISLQGSPVLFSQLSNSSL
ncbi:uncharacterized protein LOC144653612 [Oculina patagonica]